MYKHAISIFFTILTFGLGLQVFSQENVPVPASPQNPLTDPQFPYLIPDDPIFYSFSPIYTQHWHVTALTQLNLNQVQFTNWAPGGETAISGAALFRMNADYINKGFYLNTLTDLAYGLLKSEQPQGNRSPLRKNVDNLNFTAKSGQRFAPFLYFTTLLTLRTQFAPGFNFPNDSVVVSRFFSPGVIEPSLGVDYKPNSKLSLFASPLSGKLIFVLDTVLANKGLFTSEPAIRDKEGRIIEPGSTLRKELGLLFNIGYRDKILKDMAIETNLTIRNNYVDKNLDNRQNFDVNFNLTANYPFNKYLRASITVNLVYDQNVPVPLFENKDNKRVQVGTGPRTQIKQQFGLGLSYQFSNT